MRAPGPTSTRLPMLYVYILASKPQGTLYVGVTNDLVRRVAEHKTGAVPGFTRRYKVHNLVYFEAWENYEGAISREKTLKRWKRDWKRSLIEEINPRWADLYGGIAPGFTVGPG
jgi:putative endonuclease